MLELYPAHSEDYQASGSLYIVLRRRLRRRRNIGPHLILHPFTARFFSSDHHTHVKLSRTTGDEGMPL